jgi:hypothetical protein
MPYGSSQLRVGTKFRLDEPLQVSDLQQLTLQIRAICDPSNGPAVGTVTALNAHAQTPFWGGESRFLSQLGKYFLPSGLA